MHSLYVDSLAAKDLPSVKLRKYNEILRLITTSDSASLKSVNRFWHFMFQIISVIKHANWGYHTFVYSNWMHPGNSYILLYALSDEIIFMCTVLSIHVIKKCEIYEHKLSTCSTEKQHFALLTCFHSKTAILVYLYSFIGHFQRQSATVLDFYWSCTNWHLALFAFSPMERGSIFHIAVCFCVIFLSHLITIH